MFVAQQSSSITTRATAITWKKMYSERNKQIQLLRFFSINRARECANDWCWSLV